MAGWLLDAGADVNAANDLGVTPLLVACTNASAPMVDRLLAAGANPNVSSVGGESPLLVASRAGNAALVKALIAHGAQVNATEPMRGQTALMWAVANRRDEVVRVLIQAGADVHARSTVTPREYQTGSRYVAYDDVRFVVKVEEGGFTPLLFAARSGDAASADLLLAAGAKVDDPAPTGATPLVRRRAQRKQGRRRAAARSRRRSECRRRGIHGAARGRPARRCPRSWKRCSRAARRSMRRSSAARRSGVTARTSRSAPISSARRRSGWPRGTATCRSCARWPRRAPTRG